MELYRVGPLPREAREIADKASVPDWLRDATKASGQDAALGRWFTSDLTAAKWYAREHPGYALRSITASAADAAKWRATDHTEARKYASEPDHDYFVPTSVADKARAVRARELGSQSIWDRRIAQGRAVKSGPEKGTDLEIEM